MGRRGRRRKQLVYDLKEKRGYSELKREALDRTLWGTGFGGVCGTFVRDATLMSEWMNECVPNNQSVNRCGIMHMIYRNLTWNIIGLQLVFLLILVKRRDNFLYNAFNVISLVPVSVICLVTCYSDTHIMSLLSPPGARIASRVGIFFFPHNTGCFQISVLPNL
jgi:hypothetical protein